MSSEDFRDATRTDAFYDRAPEAVEADLDAEEADLVEDMSADEDRAADLAELHADWRRDDTAWDAA
jgi:hypothetical protein